MSAQYLYARSQRGKFALYYLLSLGLLCLKSVDAITNPQFWAEDGAIFYAQQTVSRAVAAFGPLTILEHRQS